MSVRNLAVALVAILPACAGDATAIVARLERSGPTGNAGTSGYGNDPASSSAGMPGVGVGPFIGMDGDAVLGPGNVYWSLYWDIATGGTTSGGASAEWLERPSRESVSVKAVSPPDLRAGLAFQFPNAELRDISKFTDVELTLDIYDGEKFEVFVGQDRDHGCSYKFDKSSLGTYSGNLATPVWCVPTQCNYDLFARGGLLLADVPKDSRLSAKVTDLRFAIDTDGVPARRASAMGAAQGPGGYCWFLANWNGGLAGWSDANPTSSSAHVRTSTQGGQVAGMAFEIRPGFKLSQYRMLVMDAVVSDGSTTNTVQFLVQAVDKSRGLTWELSGDGRRRPYYIELSTPTYPFPTNTPMSLDEVSRIEIVAKTGGGETKLDAQVFSVEFVK